MASGDEVGRAAAQGAHPAVGAALQAQFDLDPINIPVIAFDAGQTEFIDFFVLLSPSYVTEGLTATIHWRPASATSSQVRWDLAIMRLDLLTTDLDSESFAAVQSVSGDAPGTLGHHDEDDITFTNGSQMDSVVGGEWFVARLSRDHDHADDGMTGDALAYGIMFAKT